MVLQKTFCEVESSVSLNTPAFMKSNLILIVFGNSGAPQVDFRNVICHPFSP